MPARDAEDTIQASVRSVVDQTYQDWELIIIDDGSATPVPAFADRRVKVFRHEASRGVAHSRNRGARLAQGEWLAFLDADDLWDKRKLERQLAFMVRHQAQISYTATAFMDADGRLFDYVLPAVERLTHDELLRRNLMSCSSVMARREYLSRYPFPTRKNTHEDVCVWRRVVKEVGIAYGLDEPLLIYRLSARSQSANRVKSALMTYNSYRESGYNVIASLALTARYAVWSVTKRKLIYAGAKPSE
jgi:teichuronic acid biosynthesis glycosyltransferase TuaG